MVTENIKGGYAVDGFPNNNNTKDLQKFGISGTVFGTCLKPYFILIEI